MSRIHPADSAGAVTLSKMCGSGMHAMMFAHDMLLAGSANVMVARGMESMNNRTAHELAPARAGLPPGTLHAISSRMRSMQSTSAIESNLQVREDALSAALVAPGERVELVTRYSRDEISRFAMLTRDSNPVHHDRAAARRAGMPDVIASGQHTSALMSGMAATYFSRRHDGVARDMLCLNFNFAYREPIFAEHDVRLEWLVASTEWSDSLGGVIAQLDGRALVGNSTAVTARGTVLVRQTE